MKTRESTKGLLLFALCAAAGTTLAPAAGAIGAYGAAVVAAATGVIVYLTAPRWESESAAVTAVIAPTPDGEGAMAGVGGRF